MDPSLGLDGIGQIAFEIEPGEVGKSSRRRPRNNESLDEFRSQDIRVCSVAKLVLRFSLHKALIVFCEIREIM